MDFLLGIIFEIIFEGVIEGAKSKKVPIILRILLGAIVFVVFAGIILALTIAASMDEVGIKERIIFGLLAALIGLFLLISLYRFFKDNKPGKIEPPFHGVYIRTYDELPKDITIADGFFDGWPNPPSKEKHHEIMENSYMTIVAVDFGTRQIVGFINILSDGVMSAYFPLLEVIPTYKKQGIGKRLLDRAYAETKDIYMIDFACDDDMVDYYEKFGLYRTNAMIKRNYDKI